MGITPASIEEIRHKDESIRLQQRLQGLLPDCAVWASPCQRGRADGLQVMPDDHSELVPPLPIPNRTVKRLRADDSAATSVKVGNRQASSTASALPPPGRRAVCFARAVVHDVIAIRDAPSSSKYGILADWKKFELICSLKSER